MGPSTVVAEAPLLDGALRISERQKPVLVQARVAQPAVERFDERVVDGFPGTTELELHAVLMRPGIERLAAELGPVVDGDALWEPARGAQPLEQGDDARPT